jgi:hypothetical protein
MNPTGKTFSLWRKYGALNSGPVFDAFAAGAASLGWHCVDNDPTADVDVIWSVLWNGRMAANKAIWDRARLQSKPVVVLEVGGIKRGTTWKVGLNGINRDAYFGPDMGHDNNRSSLLKLKVKPWRTDGEFILIAGQHEKSEQWRNEPRMSRWVMETIESIQTQTDRPILFRPHPRCRLEAIETQYKNVYRQEPRQIPNTYDDFDMGFNNVYCTVSWTSNPGIHSVIEGIPAYTSSSSLAWPVSIKSLTNIDNPPLPDRQQWLNNYAWTEFTVEEIAQGIPHKRLTSKLF